LVVERDEYAEVKSIVVVFHNYMKRGKGS